MSKCDKTPTGRRREETVYAVDMKLREYAAIHLRVADSGVDWLDEMIRGARKTKGAKEFEDALLRL